jgi:hypothetical protein
VESEVGNTTKRQEGADKCEFNMSTWLINRMKQIRRKISSKFVGYTCIENTCAVWLQSSPEHKIF